MIGIKGNIIECYPLIDSIRKNYKEVDIYITNDKIENLQNDCKIIISSDEEKEDCISYYRPCTENEYEFDKKELLDWIHLGEEEEIKKYLKSLRIPENKKILLNHPNYSYIQEIIKEIFPNQIIDRREEILEIVEKIKKEKELSFINNGKILIIK